MNCRSSRSGVRCFAILQPWHYAILGFLLIAPAVDAGNAPGAPGGDASWTTGAKEGLGTSTTAESPLWFTLAHGVLTEVFYPRVDTPNVQDLQFVISDGSTFVDLERDDTTHHVDLLDLRSLLYQQTNTAKSGRYSITKTYFTDPARPTLLIETRLKILKGGPLQFYVLYNPSLNNSAMGDTGGSAGAILVGNDGEIACALGCSLPFVQTTSGYSQTPSDGLVDLKQNKKLTQIFDTASDPGNLVQTAGPIDVSATTGIVLALSFGSTRDLAAKNVRDSLALNLDTVRSDYNRGWNAYLDARKPAPDCITRNGLTKHYCVSLMALKAHEDKLRPGAHVASLTTPWGDSVNANKEGEGYHRVWSRDLYQVATALLAAGDAQGREIR